MPTKTLITNPNDLQLNSHREIDQIIGKTPSWLMRYGMTVMLLATIIFSTLAWFIKYPDKINSPVTIVTENPAIRVVTKTSGKINQLLVTNNQEIAEGEILAVLDNPARTEDVALLEKMLETVATVEESKAYLKIELLENVSLGNLQNTHADLQQKIKNYQHFLQQSITFGKIDALEAQIEQTKALNANIEKQKATMEEEVALTKKDWVRNQESNKSGLVSDVDLEKIEMQYLQAKRQLDNVQNQIIGNKINIEQLKTQILDLQQTRIDGRSDHELAIQQAVQQLQSEVALWKETYLLTAPIAGTVSFAKIWSAQQFVNANEEVLTIVPTHGVGKIVGRADLPVENSGKVRKGQRVNIELNGFPAAEYGMLPATVGDISLVPNEEVYTITMELPDTLRTTYDRVLPFRQEMRGTANIVTEDRRILERVFDGVRDVLKNG